MKKYLILLLLPIVLFSCKEEIIVPNLSVKCTFSPDTLFDYTVYPSLLIGLSTLETEAFSMKLRAQTNIDNTDIEVKTPQTVLNVASTDIVSLVKKDTTYTFNYFPLWDYPALAKIEQPGTVNLPLTVEKDGKLLSSNNIKLNYRSINECVMYFLGLDGKPVNTTFLFGAYVNEEHPDIDPFLQECLQNFKGSGVDQFTGYQSAADNVLIQIFMIWYTLQSKGVTYSNITETSNPSQKVATQYVRFYDQVLNNTQANCVDGTVFLASTLKKIGIEPVLITVPGHMYLGFYLEKDFQNFNLLETTMIGTANLTTIYKKDGKYYGLNSFADSGLLTDTDVNNIVNDYYTIDEIKKLVSFKTFYLAVLAQNDNYTSYQKKFGEDIQYNFLKVAKLRESISPISRTATKSAHMLKPFEYTHGDALGKIDFEAIKERF